MGLECKSRKSRDTWSNRHMWPWSTKQNRAKANRVCKENTLVIANTLFQQHTHTHTHTHTPLRCKCHGYRYSHCIDKDFPGGSAVKNPPAKAGDTVLIPGSIRCLGEGNGNPLQYSCLENPMDRGAWQCTFYGVAKSQTRLNN